MKLWYLANVFNIKDIQKLVIEDSLIELSYYLLDLLVTP